MVPFGHIIYYSVCKVTTFLHKPFYIIIKNRRDINKKKRTTISCSLWRFKMGLNQRPPD